MPAIGRLRELFDAAIDLDPEQRTAFLESACDDSELRREVLALLEADAETGALDEPFFDLHDGSAGRRIGPYEIIEEIGRGGLGVVYRAVRAEFEQRVALKVIKRGMDTDEVVRRFHRERRILGRLQHPLIARLLDGGSTEDGLPYFVMELVEGEPLDRDCERRGLSNRERVKLFVEICEAVDFAHRNLVVHRDLKPSNILIHEGRPKLLDFGIARLLTPDDDETLLTKAGSSPMTPHFASPEQQRGEATTTASDVYSLGVIQRDLLVDPDRDLRCIVDRALRDDPEQRYGSAQRLADDLRRYLEGRPVRAREGALLYRIGKFVRRHRLRLAAAASATLLLGAFLAERIENENRISAAAERADEAAEQATIRSELLLQLFTPADLNSEERFTVDELLARGASRVRENLTGEPQATQLEIFGRLYDDLGDRETARELYHEALALRRELYAGDHPLKARLINNLAASYFRAGNRDAAEPLYRESLAMRQRLGQEKIDLATGKSNLAAILMQRGDYEGAETLYHEVIKVRERVYGEAPDTATALRSLGLLLYLRGDAEDAEPLMRRALAIRLREYGERDHRTASARSSLGRVLHEIGRFAEAESELRTVLEVRRELLGEDHLHVALTQKDLAALLLERPEPNLEEAKERLDEALIALRTHRPNGWNAAEGESLRGLLLVLSDDHDAAEATLRDSHRRLLELRGEKAVNTQKALRRLTQYYPLTTTTDMRPEVPR